MGESQRTVAFVVFAVISIVIARFAGPGVPKTSGEFAEVGEMFYPDFTEADAAKSLEVTSYNSEIGSIRPFGVVQDKDGQWRIPYAHNYPADGKDQLAKTATSMIGIKKEGFAGRRESEQSEFGVLDPKAEATTDFKGVGNRITLKDGAGKVLADYIIGKEVKGKSGLRYVRRPDQKATYLAKVDINVSTKFVDWIESDLLKLDGSHLNSIDINTSSLVEGDKLQLVEGDKSHLTRKSSTDNWKLEGLDEAKEEVNQEDVKKIVTSLDELKITGVRKKPSRLIQSLKEGQFALDQSTAMDLDARGFVLIPARGGGGMQLIGKEGDIVATTDQGVRYHLRFGEIFNGSDEEVEVGFAADKDGEEKKADGDKKEPEKKDSGKPTQKSRYLLVLVHFDPAGLGPKPTPPEKPEPPVEGAVAVELDLDGIADATMPTNTAEDPKKVYEAAKSKFDIDQVKYEADLKSYKEKVKAGEKLSKSLNARFADWYYVVSGNSFENLRQGRKTLVKEKGAADAPKTGAPEAPPGINFPLN